MRHHEAETATLALAILRTQGWRFIAISPNNHVVSHIQDGEPLVATPAKTNQPDENTVGHRVRRRRAKYRKILVATDYKNILLGMHDGDTRVFPAIPGIPVNDLAKSLGNAAHRLFGKGKYEARTSESNVLITRRTAVSP